MGVVTSNGSAGPVAYQQCNSRVRPIARADARSVMETTIYGRNDPFKFLAESSYGRERNWRYNFDTRAFVSQAATTDGAVDGSWFETLTNSGTATLTSAQAGYEGAVLSTTGGASGNTNSWIATDGTLPIAPSGTVGGRIMWMTMALYLPDPNTAAYDFWLGFFNKQATPGTTPPTDGFYFKCATASSAITVVGGMTNNSTAAATSTLYTVASGAPQSIELGLIAQGGVGVDFYYRVPATPPTFVLSDDWVYGGSLSAAVNLPRVTIALRPTFAHITRTAATHAMNFESAIYGIERTRLR
jgi:hypothetical protein